MYYDVVRSRRIGELLGVEGKLCLRTGRYIYRKAAHRNRAHRIRLLRREENLRVNRLETSRPNFFSFGNLVEGPFRFIVGPEKNMLHARSMLKCRIKEGRASRGMTQGGC